MLTSGSQFRDSVIRTLSELVGEEVLAIWEIPVAETVVGLPAERLVEATAALQNDLEIWHLSAITADVGPSRLRDSPESVLRLLYHFWKGVPVTLAIELPPGTSSVDSLTGLIPGAAFYEREIFGMFGVRFGGHPDLRPLLLPDDWDGPPPMGPRTTVEPSGGGAI